MADVTERNETWKHVTTTQNEIPLGIFLGEWTLLIYRIANRISTKFLIKFCNITVTSLQLKFCVSA